MAKRKLPLLPLPIVFSRAHNLFADGKRDEGVELLLTTEVERSEDKLDIKRELLNRWFFWTHDRFVNAAHEAHA